jgi:hypothetical protein
MASAAILPEVILLVGIAIPMPDSALVEKKSFCVKGYRQLHPPIVRHPDHAL